MIKLLSSAVACAGVIALGKSHAYAKESPSAKPLTEVTPKNIKSAVCASSSRRFVTV
jgi:hypothetical protein